MYLFNSDSLYFIDIEFRKILLKTMKPLRTNYRILTWICVCPSEEPIGWCRKLAYISLISFMFIANVIFLATSVLYSIKNVSVLEDFSFSFGQIVSFSEVTYMIIAALILRHKITGVFTSLSLIYEGSK